MGLEAAKEFGAFLKETPQILPLIYQDLAQPGVKKVGIALETVLEFGTSVLLPLKLVNEKVKINFEKNLNSYKKKLEDIPQEKLCDVNPQIGIPIVEKLTYVTNEDISDMFTNLLTKASNVDTLNQAHPSFVPIIERLSVDEALIIAYLKHKEFIPFIDLHGIVSEGFLKIASKLTLVPNEVKLTFPQNIGAYWDNLLTLGILYFEPGNFKTQPHFYTPISELYKKVSEETMKAGIFSRIDESKGYFQITSFGRQFINAVTS